ncbi:hypothetical protein BD410DRAFT_790771 [Rickenella mellea]|uniref:BZIP domain-containing protein n=1 Tax=Rickenella mellea TaxID=50990 RepID=A0A4Y7PZP5_9AGAM|nr:hypothetical protein BD410DRAFT_790771 [Rickenella mellea]
MGDSDKAWLGDRQRVILYVFLSLAVVFGGWRRYRSRQDALNKSRRLRILDSVTRKREKEKERLGAEGKSSSVDARQAHKEEASPAVARESSRDTDESGRGSLKSEDVTSVQPKRSKERRRRGRDVYKDLAKLEKKTKSKTVQNSKQQHLSAGGSSASAAGSNISRSPSVASSTPAYDSAVDTPRPSTFVSAEAPARFSPSPPEIVDGRHDILPATVPAPEHEVSQNIPIIAPTPQFLASDTVPSLEEYPIPPRRKSSQRAAQIDTSADHTVSRIDSPPFDSSSGAPSLSASSVDETQVAEFSHRPHHLSGSISQPIASGSGSAEPSWLQNVSHSRTYPHSISSVSDTSSWDVDNQSQASSNYRRSPPPRFRSRSRASMSPLPPPLPSPSLGDTSLVFPTLNQTPPPHASFSAQIASYKGALQAARTREEKYKTDAERYAKECDLLRWRLREDTMNWQRREAELQAQLQHLFQTFSIAPAPPPHMPPFLQQQQPSPHTHGGFPVLTGLSPFAYPQQQQLHHHPHSHSHPHPHSAPGYPPFTFLPPISTAQYAPGSASGSPSRDAIAAGGMDRKGKMPNGKLGHGHGHSSTVSGPVPGGMIGGNGELNLNFGGESGGMGTGEESEFSEELAEAILKRPESIRSPSSASASGSTSRSGSVMGRATKNGFTFPSLSEIGNPQRTREVSSEEEEEDEEEREEGEDSAYVHVREDDDDSGVAGDVGEVNGRGSSEEVLGGDEAALLRGSPDGRTTGLLRTLNGDRSDDGKTP